MGRVLSQLHLTLTTPSTFLVKVKNRLWVLNECVERVPETYEATKQLLLYGLHGTDAKVVKALGSKKGPLPFIIKTKEDEEGEEDQEKKDFLEFERYIK